MSALLLVRPEPQPTGSPRLLYGPVLGDVSATEVVVWVAGAETPCIDIEVRPVHLGQVERVRISSPAAGGVGHRFQGLRPDTEYEVVLPNWSDGPARRFRTAPADDTAAPVSIAFSGDIGGQGFGRDEVEGLPICAPIRARRPDVFIGLGDMIYGDRSIPSRSRYGNRQLPLRNGLLLGRSDYDAHWRYLHDDAGFAGLLGETAYVACWDDHECTNNFGPGDSWGLLETARAAMLDWNPVRGPRSAPLQLHRVIRWGRHVELFVLDCRSYRRRADLEDRDPDPKTMLGDEQRAWLLAALAASRATWKIVVSSVPLTVPTGDPVKGRDGWADHASATGYERELLDLLRAMQQLGIRRPLFLCGDVHHAEVVELQPFADDSDFRPLEIVVGPMNAGYFGRDMLDPTLRPTSWFYLDPTPPPVTLNQVKRLWNFGLLQVDADGGLELSIVDAHGETRFQRRLHP